MDKAEPAALTWKKRIVIAVSAAIAGAVLGMIGWKLNLSPVPAPVQKRYETTLDLARLYSLQLEHKKAKGVYASNLDALLATAPDGPAIKARLAANTDMSTFAIVGDAKKFKLEVNLQDAERTSIKIRGPAPDLRPGPAPVIPQASTLLNPDGSPLTPGR